MSLQILYKLTNSQCHVERYLRYIIYCRFTKNTEPAQLGEPIPTVESSTQGVVGGDAHDARERGGPRTGLTGLFLQLHTHIDI